MPDMVQLVKKAAVDAVEAAKPVQFLFGQVISASPLKIQVDQKSIYTGKMLVLTRNVTDFELDITVSLQTKEATHTHSINGTAHTVDHGHSVSGSSSDGASVNGTAASVSHGHMTTGQTISIHYDHLLDGIISGIPIQGAKKIKIHNALMIGDQVVLVRMSGGKRYIVLDRIKPVSVLKGEWL